MGDFSLFKAWALSFSSIQVFKLGLQAHSMILGGNNSLVFRSQFDKPGNDRKVIDKSYISRARCQTERKK